MSDNNEFMHSTILEMKNILKPVKPERFCDTPNLKKRNISVGSDSDSIETPVKKFRDSLDATYVGSPREIRRIRSDLIEARNTISSQKDKIRHMHTVRKEMQIMFDNETKGLQLQTERDKRTIDELETQLQDIRKREIESKRALVELTNKHSLLKINLDKEITDLKSHLARATDEKLEQVTQRDIEIKDFKIENAKLKDLYNAAVDDAEAHKKLALELEKQMAEKNSIDREYQLKDQALQKAKMQIKDLEYARESWIEHQEQMKLSQHRLSNYSDLEKENKKLKEDTNKLKEEVRNKLILEEEVNDLRSRLVNFKENEKKMATLQISLAHAQVELSDWRSIGRELSEEIVPDTALPRIVRGLVEKLHQQEISLASDQLQTKSDLTALQHDFNTCRSELKKAQEKAGEMRKEVESRQKLVHRMQKKLMLISGERDNYRALLDSHERDLTITSLQASIVGGSGCQQLKDRIEGLEKMLERYRDMVTKLESDLQQADPIIRAEIAPARQQQVDRLQSDIERLTSENTVLRQEKDQLQIKLERIFAGQDEEQGKIYHMTKNPTSERITEERVDNEKLRDELLHLKQKLKKMEAGMETSAMGDTAVICPRQVAALREQIAQLEGREARVKEYYRKSIKDFRAIVYILFGYKIDLVQNDRYKVLSEYVDNEDDYLMFQLNEDGKLNLLETNFSSTMNQLIESHLIPHKSIPVFMSALTIQLFNEHTQSVMAASSATFETE